MEPLSSPTLLDLVTAVAELAASQEELVAVVAHLLSSGRVRVHGLRELPADGSDL
jgi:hypothetical protein